ncbi:MAG: DinB family protein [Microlunatus sp.]|nr:DinB family protein [Microlunatus sp.]
MGNSSALLIGYLRTYRATLFRKISGLDDDQLRSTVLPSGWTPLQLIKHLAYMERRWFSWGFLGLDLPDPMGDRDPADQQRWLVGPDETLDDLRTFLAEQAAVTEQVLTEHSLDEHAATGGRFNTDPPTLGWISFHVLQEYARHLGHLDVVRELIDNSLGE